MNSVKVEHAHKRADKEKWSASDKARRKHLIKVLKQMIERLENEDEIPAAAKPQE